MRKFTLGTNQYLIKHGTFRQSIPWSLGKAGSAEHKPVRQELYASNVPRFIAKHLHLVPKYGLILWTARLPLLGRKSNESACSRRFLF